jgi:hypothetical protein
MAGVRHTSLTHKDGHLAAAAAAATAAAAASVAVGAMMQAIDVTLQQWLLSIFPQ